MSTYIPTLPFPYPTTAGTRHFSTSSTQKYPIFPLSFPLFPPTHFYHSPQTHASLPPTLYTDLYTSLNLPLLHSSTHLPSARTTHPLFPSPQLPSTGPALETLPSVLTPHLPLQEHFPPPTHTSGPDTALHWSPPKSPQPLSPTS